MLLIRFSFQNPHRLIDSRAPLNYRGIRRSSQNSVTFDSLVYTWRKIVGKNFNLFIQSPGSQDACGCFGSYCRAHDVVNFTGKCFQRIFHQSTLNLFSGITVFCSYDLNRTALYRFRKTFIAGFYPTSPWRTREPGNIDSFTAFWMFLNKILTRFVTHLTKGNE